MYMYIHVRAYMYILYTQVYMTLYIYAAMQMWSLARFLPLVIGHLIPEDDELWDNFLCLLDIMDILFARDIEAHVCGHLEVLISEHHSTFSDLYPHASITMKMHSIIHMPRLILE